MKPGPPGPDRLIEELAAWGMAEFDTETRFRLMAVPGSAARGLEPLDRLD
jgi:hypothetical protein